SSPHSHRARIPSAAQAGTDGDSRPRAIRARRHQNLRHSRSRIRLEETCEIEIDSMHRRLFYWKLKAREIQLGERTVILGVLNVTPDSFSDGGKYQDPDRAYARALELEEQGADILDVGAESTRP